MLREDLHVGQVVVWTMFLQPFADVLLRPQNHRPDQAGLSRACVVNPIVVAGMTLQRERERDRETDAHTHTHIHAVPLEWKECSENKPNQRSTRWTDYYTRNSAT